MLAAVLLFSNAYATEADRLTRATIAEFYDPKAKIWRPKVASSDAIGTQGYTFWPSLLAWQAVIEGAKVEPKSWKPQVDRYFQVLEQYWDKEAHAYCAWTWFPGNDDHFYDDNTWAAVACMEAYGITRDRHYRDRAAEIFNGFVKGGWDPRGGLRWGTKAGIEDRKDRTVSATAAGALAALLIGGKPNQEWAKRALDWIKTLSNEDGLIRDGMKDDGTIMPTVWSYNTGVPIRAACEYVRRTGDKDVRAWAVRMGDACLDRDKAPMFDGAVTDRSKRYWYDTTYFVQYLADGMRELSRLTRDRRYMQEVRRETDYIREYLRDDDGLYWRNMRLWTIDEKRMAAFTKLTDQTTPALTVEVSERVPGNEPVEKRALAKTVLANAGVARMMWIAAKE